MNDEARETPENVGTDATANTSSSGSSRSDEETPETVRQDNGTEQQSSTRPEAEHTDDGIPVDGDTAETPDAEQEPDTMPNTIPTADVEALQAELEAAREEAGRNLEGWQRSRAEFANYKRRMDRENAQSRERAALDTLTHVLPIIDDFERAVENIPEDLQDNPWVSGTALILKKFEKLLEQHNVEVVDPVGQPFDPHLHEAVGMDDSSDYDSGVVTMTLQKGYISGDRVLRPALVRVAS